MHYDLEGWKVPRVSIITRHNVLNYGSVLQAYATEQVLRKLGYDPVTIDYRRSAEQVDNLVKRHSCGRSAMHKAYRSLVWKRLYLAGEHHFRTMRNEYLTLSEPCNEFDLWRNLPESDVYLTGSDQVWNELGDETVDGAFFWSGLQGRPSKRIVSYAASFGREIVTPGYERQIGEWLARYEAISVREDSGRRIVESYGLKAEQVLDPTLLLDVDDWGELIGSADVPKRPYALVYNLHPNSNMLEYVKGKIKESSLDIVSICPTFRRRIGIHVFLPSLPEFLALCKNASCVYTDSFHGTAFCVNFGIPFVVVFPKENAARNRSVLKLFELEDRAYDCFEGDAWDDSIDWDSVQKILQLEKGRSIAWLEQALCGESSC